MPTFFIIVIALWGLLHAYLALRLVGPLAARPRIRNTLYFFFVALVPLAPSAFFLDDALRWPWDIGLRWAAWTYMGAFTVLFAFILARDLVWWSLRLFDRARRARGKSTLLPASEERRRFLLTATSTGAVGVTGVLTSIGLRQARTTAQVIEVEVPIKGLPDAFDGYHIVQISDIHVGETIDKDFILPIVEKVIALAPDMIAVTGDIVDGSVDRLRADISPLGYLRARDGVFCVTGNHEYYSGVEEWCAHFRELGLSVLNNQHVVIDRSGKKLVLAGVTDIREGKNHPGHTSDPAAAIAGAPQHDVRILLAHQPRSAFEAKEHGYQLQLSGHTHGGQFFPWNLFVGLVQKPVAQGLGQIDELWVYVNRGTCYWGPPLRTGVPAEITSLRLKRA
jgi:predicted MPP superfamily phosphohydrolase